MQGRCKGEGEVYFTIVSTSNGDDHSGVRVQGGFGVPISVLARLSPWNLTTVMVIRNYHVYHCVMAGSCTWFRTLVIQACSDSRQLDRVVRVRRLRTLRSGCRGYNVGVADLMRILLAGKLIEEFLPANPHGSTCSHVKPTPNYDCRSAPSCNISMPI